MRRPDAEPRSDAERQPLIQELKRVMYADHPIDLLAFVSGLVAAGEPAGPLEEPGPTVSIEQLAETFLDVDLAPTTATLHVLAELLPDQPLVTRIRRELMRRTQPMPAWLRDLHATTIVDTRVMPDPLDGGANRLLGVRIGGTDDLTIVVYVDHDLGHVVKDGFALPEAIGAVAAHFHRIEAEATLDPADPADTRAALEDALRTGRMTYPPYESDTWPAARPLVEWLVGLLPEGGVSQAAREWTAEEWGEISRAFLATGCGARFDDRDHRDLLESLLWLATGYGTGNPFVWSPVKVEMLMLDLVPRKVMAPAEQLARLPDLLRAFVRYAHELSSIEPRHTRLVLGVIDDLESEYQRTISGESVGARRRALEELLDVAGQGWDRVPLEDHVGGTDQLARLNAEPLPDEPFDETEIPEDLMAKVDEIRRLCDQNADQFLDVEHRTANRRLLRKVALASPSYFRGRAAARTHAAAICWMVANANNSFDPQSGLQVGELLAPFGVKSASQRATKFRELLELPPYHAYDGPMALGDPSLLVAQRRAELMESFGLE